VADFGGGLPLRVERKAKAASVNGAQKKIICKKVYRVRSVNLIFTE
jgi:hypothetical protein